MATSDVEPRADKASARRGRRDPFSFFVQGANDRLRQGVIDLQVIGTAGREVIDHEVNDTATEEVTDLQDAGARRYGVLTRVRHLRCLRGSRPGPRHQEVCRIAIGARTVTERHTPVER
jgi:hypothetical protein